MRWAFGLLALVAAGSSWAQTGGLRVVVTDAASQAPLEGAEVVLTSATRRVVETRLATGPSGTAHFPVLHSGGGYAVTVRLPGYAIVELQDVRVVPGRTSVVPVGLFPELREALDVSARREGVDLAETRASTTFTSEFTEALPLYGRFYQTVLTLAPGVLDADGDGNPNVHGARVADFKAEVGGVANTDPLTGGFLSYINLESVDALEVITAGAGAAFGRAQGGYASIVQKQGGNDFEGVAGLLWGSDLLDGNGASPGKAPDFDRIQPFLQVSGPIVRDRLWYRLSHEWLEREDPVDLRDTLGVTRLRQQIHSDQLTWQLTPRNKLALQFQRDPLRLENAGIRPGLLEESAATLERGGSTTSLTWTVPYSARLFGQGVTAWQDHREEVFPQVAGLRGNCAGGGRWYRNLSRGQCTEVFSGQVRGSWPVDSRDHRQRFTVRGQATLSLDAGGTIGHQLKGGFSVENERYFRRMSREIESTVQLRTFGAPEFGIQYSEFRLPNESVSRAVGSVASVFLEDQARIGSRVAVTAGVRVDFEQITAVAKEVFDPADEVRRFRDLRERGATVSVAMQGAFTAIDDVDDYALALSRFLGVASAPITPLMAQSTGWPRNRKLDNLELGNTLVSPRLAAAWDPWGSGKTRLAATAGRYHDKVFLSVPLLGTEAPTSLARLDVQKFDGTWALSGNVPAGAELVRVTMVDPGLRTPYQDEVTVSAERELLPETTLKATWVRRRFRDQLQDVDVNHAAGDHGRCVLNFDTRNEPLVPSPGEGRVLVDPFTGETYVDTDPGPGDGRMDDCIGRIVRGFVGTAHRPDGLPDLYALNPVWGQVMVVRNANTADYSGFILELQRRHANGWGMQASYTWSRAVGDAEAFDQRLGDEPPAVRDERSYLAYDQRHVAKVAAAVDTKRDWRLGVAVRWESGTPYSRVSTVTSYYGNNPEYGFTVPLPLLRDLYPSGRRNDGRNRGFFTFDARVAREFQLSSGRTWGLVVEGFNLLNDDTLQIQEIRDGVAYATRRFGRRLQVGLRAAF